MGGKALQGHKICMEEKEAVEIEGRHLIRQQQPHEDIAYQQHDVGHDVVVQLDVDDAGDFLLCSLQALFFSCSISQMHCASSNSLAQLD